MWHVLVCLTEVLALYLKATARPPSQKKLPSLHAHAHAHVRCTGEIIGSQDICDHKAPGSGDSTTPISILHFVLAHEHHSCLLILLIRYTQPRPLSNLYYEYTSSSHLPLPWHPCTCTRPRALLPTLTLALTIRSQTIHPYNTPTRPIPIEPPLSLTRSLRAPRLLTDARGIPVALTQQPS